MLVLGIVFAPLGILALLACAMSNGPSKGDPGSRGETYGSTGCHGTTGGYKATRTDELGRKQVMTAAGYWSI
jgi:hypothetical protein